MSPLRYDDDSLFGRYARSTDPQTAKDAAASMTPEVLSKQRLQVLESVALWPLHGRSAYDVAQATGIQQSVVARRFTDLRERGLIEDTGDTGLGSSGRRCAIYRITAEGKQAIR